jgi:hypothetical protein
MYWMDRFDRTNIVLVVWRHGYGSMAIRGGLPAGLRTGLALEQKGVVP